MKKTFLLCGFILLALNIPAISPIAPKAVGADIYQWKDENGTINFTDSPSNIPKQYRSRQKIVLRGPAEGRPGVTVIESPASNRTTVSPAPFPPTTPSFPWQASPQVQEEQLQRIEQLQAKISAKEKFIADIDRKRSHALNPLGNRFVSPEDLELYKKYSEELPQDRQRLNSLQ